MADQWLNLLWRSGSWPKPPNWVILRLMALFREGLDDTWYSRMPNNILTGTLVECMYYALQLSRSALDKPPSTSSESASVMAIHPVSSPIMATGRQSSPIMTADHQSSPMMAACLESERRVPSSPCNFSKAQSSFYTQSSAHSGSRV